MKTLLFFISRCLLSLLPAMFYIPVQAQVTIQTSGSTTCVGANSQQTFYIMGSFPPGTNMNWCVNGGSIVGSTTGSCRSGLLPGINVIWGSGGTGSVTLSSTLGSGAINNITIYAALSTGSITSSSSVQLGYNAVPPTITATVATGGGCGTVNYQWESSADNANWSVVNGATGQNMSFSSGLTQTTYYRRRNMGTAGGAGWTHTSTVTMYVVAPLTGGTVTPASQDVFPFHFPATLSGTLPTGGSCAGAYTYQWFSSTDNVNYTPIGSATGATYSSSPLPVTTWFKRRVACAGEEAFSNAVVVNVYPLPSAGTIYTNNATMIRYNSSPGEISSTAASGGICGGNYTYEWYARPDGSNYAAIPGATGVTYTPGNLTVSTTFRKRMLCAGVETYSNELLITVTPQLQPGTSSAPATSINTNTSPGLLTGTAPSGGICGGAYTYQWQSSPNGITFTDISGATSPGYDPGNLTATVSYRRLVRCVPVEEAASNVVTILVNTGAPDALNTNYVRTREFFRPLITDKAVADAQTDRNDVKQTTDYFDGLGRKIQQVIRQFAGPSGTPLDVVQHVEYDPYGRESNKYMIYAGSGSDGNYKTAPLPDQQAFNATQFPGESSFLSKVIYEASPLNRTVQVQPQGSSWSGVGRGALVQHMTNTANDAVRIWQAGNYISTGTYPAGTLFKQITTDDNGKIAVQYKDKYDKVILRKIQVADVPGADHAGWLCTYYVHDEHKNITMIIQPAAVEAMHAANNWNLTFIPSLVPEFCYEYSYDQRNRQIMKRYPGAKEQYMFYDAYDRLILTQDGELRKTNKWIFTKYDGQDRPVMTGFFTDNTHIGLSSMKTYVEGTYSTSGRFESRDNGQPHGYTTGNSFPVVASQDWLTVKYYDDYSWCASQGMSSTRSAAYDGNFDAASNSTWPYPQALTQSNRTTGLETGSKARVLDGTTSANVTVLFYDDQDRVVQTQVLHHGGATDITTTQYDFADRMVVQHQRHSKGGSNTQEHEVVTRYLNDHAGRNVQVQKTISGTGATSKAQQAVVTKSYNNLGELAQKQFGAASSPVEVQDYKYHVRGWLQSINKAYLEGTATRYFAEELGFDKATAAVGGTSYAANQFNGDISGTLWKSRGDGIARKYDYQYDHAYRITRADFTENAGGSWNNATTDFSVYGAPEHNNRIAYDANGNILSMFQKGLKLTASAEVDKMRYVYHNSGYSNRLLAVTEDASIGNTNQQLGDFTDNNTAANDYTFDDNGNLITDQNRRISGITYNHLNLPWVVTVLEPGGSQKGTITFVYDALGNKLKKIISETGQPAKTILYAGGAMYENDVLQSIGHEDGRIRFKPGIGGNPGKYELDYFLKDHLLNVRAVLTEEALADPYPILSFEGTSGSQDVITQDQWYENKNGLSINVAGVRTTYPASFNASNPPPSGVTNTYAMAVNKAAGAIGAAKLLKVMSGDRIHVKVSYWYAVVNANNTLADGRQSIVNSLVSALTQSAYPSALIKGNVSTVTTSLGGNNDLGTLLNKVPATNGGNSAPKAYLNVVFFDEQFRFDAANSQSYPVEYIDNNVQRTIDKTMSNAVPVAKNGYVYAYFSNEATDLVYFDNFQVTHEHGKLLEETHYYPFGLTMRGISARAMNIQENRKGYNGNELQRNEFSDGSGLEVYDFNARTYDQQTGRFLQLDPLTEEWQEHLSLYHFGANNPARYNDPDGKILPFLAVIAIRFAVGALIEYGSQVYTNYTDKNKRGWDAWKVTNWRDGAKIFVNGATSTVAPGFKSGYVNFAIEQTTNVAESVAGQLLEDGGKVTWEKTTSDLLFMNIASKVEIDLGKKVDVDEARRKLRDMELTGTNPSPAQTAAQNQYKKETKAEMAKSAASKTASSEAAESATINKWGDQVAAYLQQKKEQAAAALKQAMYDAWNAMRVLNPNLQWGPPRRN